MFKVLNILVMLLMVFGCASSKTRKFDAEIANGKCEEASQAIPTNLSSMVLNQTKWITSTIASYSLTGITYGTEITLYASGGIIGGVVICSPVIVLEGSMKSSGDASFECIRLVGKTIMEGLITDDRELYGKKVFKTTRNWRCPDLSDFSRGARKVASCYEKRGQKEDFKKAKEQIQLIREKDFYESCIDDKERQEIQKHYERLKTKHLKI